MRAAHRPEHQDDGEQSERGGAGVLGQLKPDVIRRQLLSSDTRSDHNRRKQQAADELGTELST
jgi:hypothetical protein